MKKFSLSLVVLVAFLITAHHAGAESWLSKTFGLNGTAFKMLGASVMNITTIDSVQRKLIEVGTLSGPVTGVADTQTVQAVKTFQATNNLKVDGVVGKETLKVLDPGALSGMSSSTTAVPVDKWKSKCLAIQGQAPQPYIEVISPNGGEVYQAGQQVTIKWRSCNLPANEVVAITLNKGSDVYQLVSNAQGILASAGQVTINLPNPTNWSQFQSGNFYRVSLFATHAPFAVSLAEDYSDSLFTIFWSGSNSGTSSSATSTAPLLLKPLDASSAIGFGGNNGGAGSLSGSHLVSLKNTSSSPVWIACDAVGVAPEFVGNHNGFSGTMMCNTSLGTLQGNLSNSLKLDPGQEVIFNRTVVYSTPLSYSNLDVDFRTKITHMRYRPTQSSTNDIVILPQDHPQFQSSWNALLASPWLNY